MFSGNLGCDAEVITFQNGGRMIKFSVAVDERHVKDDAGQPIIENGFPKTDTEWYRCQIYVAPDKNNDTAKCLTQGRFVAVSAFPQAEAWMNKNNELTTAITWNVQRVDF